MDLNDTFFRMGAEEMVKMNDSPRPISLSRDDKDLIFWKKLSDQRLLFLSPDDKKRAVRYLIDTLPPRSLEIMAGAITADGPRWWVRHHLGLGMAVRNLLRRGGYRADPLMDGLWIELAEQAVKETYGISCTRTQGDSRGNPEIVLEWI